MSDNRARALEGEPDWALRAALKNPNVGAPARERVLAELARREGSSAGPAEGKVGVQPAASGALPMPRRMNKTEARWADVLEAQKRAGEIESWAFEEFSVRVGKTRCFYRPDFVTYTSGPPRMVRIYEVKGGFVRPDSRVKFESAAKQWPNFHWTMVQWAEGQWAVIADYPPTQGQ